MDPKKCKKITSDQNMMCYDEMQWTNKIVPKHCQMAKMEDNQYISPSDCPPIFIKKYSLDIYSFSMPIFYSNIGIKWTKTMAKKWQKMKADQ